ncbi:MAG: hypothetical protein UV75_C0023G0002 [Candidatus Giovannonibacteria bacterium GW2011_GWA1_43_15]|nr:MAG: hypothetical protein UV75_C0023G0002 [Candidatus Giovannonibacteria bacterium GW2011_GWA1_43_15]
MKFKEKLTAINLRKSGKSYREILNKLRVSKGTLSLWLRDVKLTPEQEKELYVDRRQRNAYKLAKISQKKKEDRTKEIISKAEKEALLRFHDPLFLAGLMLYWAEGDKSERNELVKFTNSDPEMVRFMMKWFREICDVPEEKFKINLYIHKLHCRRDIERYWSNITKIPLSHFYKTHIKPTSLRHRRNPSYNGTCAVRVSNVDLYRKIKGWKLGFVEKVSI